MVKLPFNEFFLHYVWQHSYFSLQNLFTQNGEKLEILSPGYHNTNEGPDFLNAKVKINNVEWVGSVEIHLSANDWYTHGHHANHAYNQVVLHVVYDVSTKATCRADGTNIPVFCLLDRIYNNILEKAQLLQAAPAPIYCSNFISTVPEYVRTNTLEKALVSRLQRKAKLVLKLAETLQFDWDETAYRLLCEHMGAKVNNEAFVQLAESIPYKTILKCIENPHQMEALLLGQAGFLSDQENTALAKEYRFLQQKFALPPPLNAEIWKHFRLRPAAFPEHRIKLLAWILAYNQSVFYCLTQGETVQALYSNLTIRDTTKPKKPIGSEWLKNLIINTSCLLSVAYGLYMPDQSYTQRALVWLEGMPFEDNVITRKFTSLGWQHANAFDSQALIELYNEHCTHKKCLTCSLGTYVVAHS